MKNSSLGVLTTSNWKAIVKGAAIAAGGALVTYIAAKVDVIDWSTYGQYGALLSSAAAIIINFLRLWLGTSKS